jgi:hypothetical protein
MSNREQVIIRIYKRRLEVVIATGYGLDGRGSIPGRGNISLFPTTSRQYLEAHPASYPMGTRGYFPEDKFTWRKTD